MSGMTADDEGIESDIFDDLFLLLPLLLELLGIVV